MRIEHEETKIGIFLSLMLVLGLCLLGEQKSNNKLVLNEVLIENESNFRMTTEYTAHGLKYSTDHLVAQTLPVVY